MRGPLRELVADPIDEMRRVYEQLELGGFEAVRPAIEQYFSNQKDYKTNRYQTPPAAKAEINRRWQAFFEQYGYETDGAAAPEPLSVGG